ncbi:MAG: IS1595 family transposase [Balneola sp.]
MNNKYYRRSKISEAQFRFIIKCFSMDLKATETSELSAISLRSVTVIFDKLRMKIAQWCQQETPFSGIVEVDESYFGPRRIPGKRGRGASGKTIVFGVFKRAGKVYTEIVPDARKKTLQDIIRGKVAPESIIHSDGWRGYNGLVDVGYNKHYRVHHGANEFARGTSHINGIESFWSFAKRRLAQFNGIPKSKFNLYLKETEFRFNHRNDNLYQIMLHRLRKEPI